MIWETPHPFPGKPTETNLVNFYNAMGSAAFSHNTRGPCEIVWNWPQTWIKETYVPSNGSEASESAGSSSIKPQCGHVCLPHHLDPKVQSRPELWELSSKELRTMLSWWLGNGGPHSVWYQCCILGSIILSGMGSNDQRWMNIPTTVAE